VKNNRKKLWKTPMTAYTIMIFLTIILYIQFVYLSLSPTIYGKNMDEFAASRNTVKRTLKATRGTIYDSEHNILALNVTSYTVIAYLEKSKVYTKDNYVKDVEATAEALANILGGDKDTFIKYLSQDKYQVELGIKGKGITELKKEEIEALKLPGIDFTEEQKRYYPNGDFASYVIGYAKENEIQEESGIIKEIVGELGIEAKYNDLLKGKDGYLKYQQDKYGYKIAGTQEEYEASEDGYNIYLTIDANIQRFIEKEIKEAQEKYTPEWITISVMDAKTGDILGTSSTPSFDPNLRNITNYENPLVSIPFEPGSTMKTFTYMCALENNVYDGNETFMSGSYEIGEDKVNDWNNIGWGEITFDKGFEYSSNVGIANLLQTKLTKKQLRECYKKYGFGEKTGIELSREQAGNISFNYPIEVVTAGFGQGITTTPIQQLQALTMVANDGYMLKPHIVSKIVNPNTGEYYYERELEKEKIVSSETINKIKELMYNTVQGTDEGSTGYPYRIEGFDVIGKTGTAQIYDSTTGTYLVGDNAYIFSFAGMYPYDDPEIIIYAAMKKPSVGKSGGLSSTVKEIMKSIAKYKNMFVEEEQNDNLFTYETKSYLNKKTEIVKKELEENNLDVVIVGNGDRIINQSILPNNKLIYGEKIILLTNSLEYTLPNLKGWSRKEVLQLFELLNLKYKINGYGYVVSQNIEKGTVITKDMIVEINLENKILEESEGDNIWKEDFH